MKYKALILIFIFCFIFLINPTQGKVEKVTTHEVDIITKKVCDYNMDKLYGLTFFGPKAFIIELQCSPQALTPEYLKLLNNYIKQGGTIWIYDCFLAEIFGMKPAPFNAAKLKLKRTKIDYGLRDKRPAFLCRSIPEYSHPLATNVKQVDALVLEIIPGVGSGIKEQMSEDFHPFLRTVNGNHLIGAIKEIGKGKVIFRPVIKEKYLDGKRFEINLKEFSAGYSPPLAAAAVCEARIFFKNGQIMKAKIVNKSFDLETGTSSHSLELYKIKRVEFLYPPRFDEIYLKTGEVLKGLFITSTINIQTAPKRIKKLEKSFIEKIVFDD